MEEAIILGAKKALKMLGIDKKENSETIFSTEGMPIPFDDGVLDFGAGAEVPFDKIANGSTCKVVWDSVAYICAAKVGSNGIDIGDIDGNDGSIPFYIHAVKHSDEWSVSIWADTPEPSHIIDLYLQTETIHPISDKYLPGVCLPVVELETDIDGAGSSWETTMAEADWAKLTAIESADTPITIKFISFDYVENVCLNKINMGQTVGYFGIIIDSEGVLQWLTLMHMPGSDAWMAQTKPITTAS